MPSPITSLSRIAHASPVPVQTTFGSDGATASAPIAVTGMLSDFGAFNDFLADVADLLTNGDWDGEYQVASFHPQYRFQGTKAGDAGNLTNRAPWPILHLIRESSIDAALADYPQPESIPERNIQKMKSLSADERRALFPWVD